MLKPLDYLKGLVALLYPELCAGCGKVLFDHEKLICTHCLLGLPETGFHKYPHNIAAQQFWGRIKLEHAASFLYFTEQSCVQRILHQFKYRSRPEIGALLGSRYGKQLYNTPFCGATVIIPVPLHPRKLKKRGYNQSVHFANGLAKQLQLPVLREGLVLDQLKASQTSKKRFDRYENMRGVFRVVQPERFKGQHILLVDDVLTTGATLEACALPLLEIEGVKVSVLTLAFTK